MTKLLLLLLVCLLSACVVTPPLEVDVTQEETEQGRQYFLRNRLIIQHNEFGECLLKNINESSSQVLRARHPEKYIDESPDPNYLVCKFPDLYVGRDGKVYRYQWLKDTTTKPIKDPQE